MRGRTGARIALTAGLLAAVGAGSYFGNEWYRQVPLREITVSGHSHAEEEALVELIGLDSVQFVSEVDRDVAADRVRRHPWVREASVTRWPTGRLQVRVMERTPVLLALDRRGGAVHYLDAEGFAMPLLHERYHNVPLLRGAPSPEHPLRPVDDERVLELAEAVGRLDPPHQSILSEFELRGGEVWLRTTGTAGGRSIPVRLGRSGFGEKLRRLHAFWHQAVQTQTETHFELVDLRFDSQIVTREQPEKRTGQR